MTTKPKQDDKHRIINAKPQNLTLYAAQIKCMFLIALKPFNNKQGDYTQQYRKVIVLIHKPWNGKHVFAEDIAEIPPSKRNTISPKDNPSKHR